MSEKQWYTMSFDFQADEEEFKELLKDEIFVFDEIKEMVSIRVAAPNLCNLFLAETDTQSVKFPNDIPGSEASYE